MSQSPPDHPRFPSDNADASGNGSHQPGPLPRWRLVLHNNEAADMMFVVYTIMELTRFCRTEAILKMWVAHRAGRSLLLTTHRERAELYVEQFADKGMTVTAEPL
jgi:ATP-dependent Clp protease adapter protein ClpS